MTLLTGSYKLLTSLAAPLLMPAFLASARGRRNLSERYGAWPIIEGNPFWFHGSSVGEVRGILPIVSDLQERLGTLDSLLTATSPTALDEVSFTTTKRLAPFDAPFIVARTLGKVSPKSYIFGETELWPVLLGALLDKGVPVHLVNGRISDYTYSTYLRFRNLFVPHLSRFETVSAVSQQAAERFIALGAKPERVMITGNTKYDTALSVDRDVRRKLREDLFPGHDPDVPMIVLGSVRPGEERKWFEAFRGAVDDGAKLKLVVAPRHAEKFEYFAQALSSLGLPFRRWTEPGKNEAASVVLLDAMGILARAYSLAKLAFIGATLVDVGGHNPLEACQFGVPVAVGPHISVIRDVVDSLESRSALFKVETMESIVNLVSRVARGDPELISAGERGREVWQSYRGATKTIVTQILGSGRYA